jgi:hypothetical protein
MIPEPAQMNDTKLADLAVSILSQLPTPKVEAFSAGGGVVMLELQSQDGAYILADAPRQQVGPALDLLVRTNEISGGGYDISLTVEDTLHQTEWMIGVRLRVLDVLRRESERTTPRAAVEELALMHVLGARKIAEGEEFDVRLADLSPFGVAFVTDRSFHTGDFFAMMVTIRGRLLRLQARALQTSPSHYGRQRVGCEILQISDDDRRRISVLAEEAPQPGTAEQRFRRSA